MTQSPAYIPLPLLQEEGEPSGSYSFLQDRPRWTGQAYFQIITDQASILTTAERCFGIKFQPVLHNPTWLLILNMPDCQTTTAMKGNIKVCLLKYEYACETMCSLLPLKPVTKY